MQEIPQLKNDLVSEIDSLRQRLRVLEDELTRCNGNVNEAWKVMNPRADRQPFEGTFTFTGDFDEVEARGVDLSEGGVSFEICGDLPFSLQVRQNGKVVERFGSLVWARRMSDGKCRFGFEFVDSAEDEDEFDDEVDERVPGEFEGTYDDGLTGDY